MEDNIQIFENPEFGSIRIIEQNGEPWFVARGRCGTAGVHQTLKCRCHARQ